MISYTIGYSWYIPNIFTPPLGCQATEAELKIHSLYKALMAQHEITVQLTMVVVSTSPHDRRFKNEWVVNLCNLTCSFSLPHKDIAPLMRFASQCDVCHSICLHLTLGLWCMWVVVVVCCCTVNHPVLDGSVALIFEHLRRLAFGYVSTIGLSLPLSPSQLILTCLCQSLHRSSETRDTSL